MNPQQEAVALFQYLEGRGFKPSVRFVGRQLRELGLSFDDKDLRQWLSAFHRGGTAAAPQHIKEDTATAPQVHRGSRAPHKVSLVSNSVESNDSTQRAPKQETLGLNRPDYAARDAILKAIWSLVQPAIGRAVTYSLWKARNGRVAADLARLGWTPERVVTAWRQASDRRGEPVRELSVVQKHIEQVAAAVARPTLARLVAV